MAVFGEETLPLPIFNGLGITDRPNDTLCNQLQNLFLSDVAEYRVREDFVAIQVLTNKTPVVIPTTQSIPRSLLKTTLEVFQAIGSESVDSPTILTFYDNGTTRDVTWLNCNNTTPLTANINQTIPSGYGVKAFCQYKDRFYASNGLQAGKIYRLSNFTTTPATAITCTDLLATNGVDILLTFRSRVFGIKKNRIYYTDLPAIGGYPETWNASTNFIDVPSIDYDVTVHNAAVYRDKIYLFTDKGIYIFNVVGAPINWSIQLVSSNFPIYDRDSVCINKNMVFLTDQQSVVQFDGTTFKNVSSNIRSIFHNSTFQYSWFSVYPWEDGIILCRNAFDASGGNYTWGNNVSNNTKRILYFNTSMWTEVEMTININQVVKAGRSLLPYRGKVASSWMTLCTSSVGNYMCEFLDGGNWKGDCPSSVDHTIARQRKPIVLETPAPFTKSRTFKKYKYVDIYGYINCSTAGGTTLIFNGENLAAGDMGKSIFKAPIDSVLGSQFKGIPAAPLLITGQLDVSPIGSNFPGMLIYGIDLAYNQDNRGRDGMGT